MKLLRSYKVFRYDNGVVKLIHIPKLTIILTVFLLFSIFSFLAYADIKSNSQEIKTANVNNNKLKDKIKKKYEFVNKLNKAQNSSNRLVANDNHITAESLLTQTDFKSNHLVVSTIFWVGEAANSDNDYIANKQSAWDANWQSNYGGIDAPSPRNNYYPSGFTPKENPFYVALPYNDINEQGSRKPTASNCNKYSPKPNSNYSWCKNTWVKVVSANQTAYAQWQDVGPYLEDDVSYVFGNTSQNNDYGSKAGIDVSPAVADYLKLSDVDIVYWEFIAQENVPNGPWKDIVTNSQGYTVY